MKKALLTAAILTFGIAGLHAQDNQATSKTMTSTTASRNGNPKMMVSMRVNRLEKELQLTSDQKQKVTDILTEASQNPDRAAARTEADAKITQVLTEEQAAKYEAMKAQRKEAAKQKAAN